MAGEFVGLEFVVDVAENALVQTGTDFFRIFDRNFPQIMKFIITNSEYMVSCAARCVAAGTIIAQKEVIVFPAALRLLLGDGLLRIFTVLYQTINVKFLALVNDIDGEFDKRRISAHHFCLHANWKTE